MDHTLEQFPCLKRPLLSLDSHCVWSQSAGVAVSIGRCALGLIMLSTAGNVQKNRYQKFNTVGGHSPRSPTGRDIPAPWMGKCP